MQSNNENNYWKIDIEKERDFIKKHIILTFITLPELCPYCKKGKVGLRNNNSINNPILGKCNYYKCTRNLYLRNRTIFQFNSKTPYSIIYKILNYWLIEEKNAVKIKKSLEENYNINNININIIFELFTNFRKAISSDLRNKYCLDRLANTNSHQQISIDESLFIHWEGIQVWVVGLINLNTDEIRLEIVENRDQQTMKTIIEKHICKGNIINADSWPAYNFLDNIDSGFLHNSYNHNRGIFGLTSRIESIWDEMKEKIKSMYHTINNQNFIYFLSEAEFRRIIKNMNSLEKIETFAKLLSTLDDGENINFLNEEDLKKFNYDTYFDD